MNRLLTPIPCGRLFGIPIQVVPAVFLLLILALLAVGAGGGDTGALLLLLLLLAVSLLAHELAHALVARALGLSVIDITIWPLGGMARMEGLAHHPSREAPVAAAGPAANLMLAGLCVLIPGRFGDAAVMMNLILGLGNLVPAFPLDGGRLLRAWFASHNPMVDATAAAARVSRWVAVGLFLLAAWKGSLLFGIILAIYLWITSSRELYQVVVQEGRLPTRPLGEVLRRCYSGAPADELDDIHRPFPEDSQERGDATDVDELENFHGSLDDYFRNRK